MQTSSLIPYNLFDQSTLYWNNRPGRIQEFVIQKSFQAQIADYNHFHRNGLKDVIRKLFLSKTPSIQSDNEFYRISLDSAISNARNLSDAKLFLNVMRKQFGPYLAIYPSSRQNDLFSRFFGQLPTTAEKVVSKISYPKLKTRVPLPPSFVQNDDRWNTFERYFQDKAKRIWYPTLFPKLCHKFTPELEQLLVMSYNAKYRNGKIFLTIEGREAVLERYRVDHPELGIHYYIVLSLDKEEWIIDPTWKQFAGKQVNEETATHEFIINDPYNERLKQEFPDILVIKRQDLFALLRELGKEAESEEISQNARCWDKTIQKPVSTIADDIEDALSVSPGNENSFDDMKQWKIYQTLTGNKSPSFVHFSRIAMSSS